MNWGNDASNSRFVPQPGLAAADLPRLKLKWAFGFEGITTARVQPAMAGGKVFVASDNGSITHLIYAGRRWLLRRFNETAHLHAGFDLPSAPSGPSGGFSAGDFGG